ncbi:MAG: hypothetical protein U5K28_05055 [Halobacteriales archaeon]|nr:hypothetical protein [Halobacteriales archaeon]
MSYPRTHVDHRNPDHHESMHPTRNIVNAHVVAGEFLTSRYHDALQTVLHPLGESLDTKDQHALNDLGIVHADWFPKPRCLLSSVHTSFRGYEFADHEDTVMDAVEERLDGDVYLTDLR